MTAYARRYGLFFAVIIVIAIVAAVGWGVAARKGAKPEPYASPTPSSIGRIIVLSKYTEQLGSTYQRQYCVEYVLAGQKGKICSVTNVTCYNAAHVGQELPLVCK